DDHSSPWVSPMGVSAAQARREAVPEPVARKEASSPPPLSAHLEMPFKDAKELWVSSFEREYVQHLLRKNRNNISHAARESDIDRKYFRKLMRKYDIEGPKEEVEEEE